MPNLVEHLKKLGVLRTSRVIEAFLIVDRRDFVPPEYAADPYVDWPLPIGAGQTISQPYTVAFMLELLGAGEGHKVLDVGSGSGWTTALLAYIVGKEGSVQGVEIVPELVEFGKKNISKYDFPHADIALAKESVGFPEKAPYDRILVSASASELPQTLINELKPEGVLVIPIGTIMTRIHKSSDGALQSETYPGFAFVPLI